MIGFVFLLFAVIGLLILMLTALDAVISIVQEVIRTVR